MSCLKLGHFHFTARGLGSLAYLGPCSSPTPLGLIVFDFVICHVFIVAMGPSPPLCGWLELAYLLVGLSSLAAFGAVCLTLCVYSSSHVVLELFYVLCIPVCGLFHLVNVFWLCLFGVPLLPLFKFLNSFRDRMSHMMKLNDFPSPTNLPGEGKS